MTRANLGLVLALAAIAFGSAVINMQLMAQIRSDIRAQAGCTD